MRFNERIHYFVEESVVYLIDGGLELALIDCGFEKRVEGHLRSIEEAGFDIRSLRKLIVTHSHCDHIGGASLLKELTRIELYAHPLAVDPIEKADPLATGSWIPYTEHSEPFSPCKVEHTIEHASEVSVGNLSLKVHHTPGHTPGSIALELDGNLFVGDTLFADGGVGWIDAHWGSNVEDFRDSLRYIEELSPQYILPAHGEPFPFSNEIVQKAIERVEFYFDPANGLGRPRTKRHWGWRG